MWKHLFILIVFCTLVIGICATIRFHYLWKMHRFKFLEHLAFYTLFLNLAIFQLLISFYLRVNLPASWPPFHSPLLGEVWTYIASLFVSGLIFSQFLVFRDLKGESDSIRCFPWLLAWGATVTALYLGKILLPGGYLKRIAVFMVDDVIDSLILMEMVIIIVLIATAGKISEPGQRRLAKAFGYLYLSRYGGLALMYFSRGIPRLTWLMLASAVFLYANFVSFLWIRFFFTNYLGQGFKAWDHRENLDALMEKYSLSKREREILILILEGRNNKEIDAQLYISYHTVKNHVTSIYRKVKVKNRYQLIHLLTKKTV